MYRDPESSSPENVQANRYLVARGNNVRCNAAGREAIVNTNAWAFRLRCNHKGHSPQAYIVIATFAVN